MRDTKTVVGCYKLVYKYIYYCFCFGSYEEIMWIGQFSRGSNRYYWLLHESSHYNMTMTNMEHVPLPVVLLVGSGTCVA